MEADLSGLKPLSSDTYWHDFKSCPSRLPKSPTAEPAPELAEGLPDYSQRFFGPWNDELR